ncbi:MAG: hypothetical protein ACFFCQ_05235 [Promethearchaeota archaeon]
MIIKNLLITTNAGICLFHYKTPQSDLKYNEHLFSSLITAISSIITFFTKESIDYIQIGSDRLYLLPLESQESSLILSTIISGEHDEYITQFFLSSIGEQFLISYANHLEKIDKENIDWELITGDFKEQIESVWNNRAFQEAARREMVKEMFHKLNLQSPDTLTAMEFINDDVITVRVQSMFTNV